MNHLTINDAARLLKIHPESVRRLIRAGRLKAKKVGNMWMVSTSYLLQYATTYDPNPGRPTGRQFDQARVSDAQATD